MATSQDAIDHAILLRLAEAGADVISQPGGWGVVVKGGLTERAHETVAHGR
jgi:hypothetical protein